MRAVARRAARPCAECRGCVPAAERVGLQARRSLAWSVPGRTVGQDWTLLAAGGRRRWEIGRLDLGGRLGRLLLPVHAGGLRPVALAGMASRRIGRKEGFSGPSVPVAQGGWPTGFRLLLSPARRLHGSRPASCRAPRKAECIAPGSPAAWQPRSDLRASPPPAGQRYRRRLATAATAPAPTLQHYDAAAPRALNPGADRNRSARVNLFGIDRAHDAVAPLADAEKDNRIT